MSILTCLSHRAVGTKAVKTIPATLASVILTCSTEQGKLKGSKKVCFRTAMYKFSKFQHIFLLHAGSNSISNLFFLISSIYLYQIIFLKGCFQLKLLPNFKTNQNLGTQVSPMTI